MSSFLHTIANRLVPLFLTPNGTQEAAKAAATHAINAYRPETPADILRVARILALSFATKVNTHSTAKSYCIVKGPAGEPGRFLPA